MKRTISILSSIAISMTAFSTARAEMYIPATDPQVRVMGRVAESGGSITMGFPGTEIELRFSGASYVGMDGTVLSGDGWFNVYVDGESLPVLQIPQGDYNFHIKEGLDPNKEHLLRIVRRSESWEGVVSLSNFELNDGATVLPPSALPARKIMVIGDSITCGQNTELVPPREPGNQNANAELAFGWLLAKDFNAQVDFVSYGGKGVVRDWRGMNSQMLKDAAAEGTLSNPGEVLTAPMFFERALPDDASSEWDHSLYVPDLVTICLGQNDYSQVSLPTSEYAEAYINFVERIHEVYPGAKIVILSSPMAEMSRSDGWQPRGISLQRAITLVHQHFLQKGETFVTPFFLSHQPGTSIDAHPIAPQHRAMTNEMEPLIEALTGWGKAQ